MSKLYKKVNVLTSRAYYHGGSGLEDCGLRFFRSEKDYEEKSSEHGWQKGVSLKSSWCTPPVLVEAWISPKDWKRFMAGELELTPEKVLFAGSLVTAVHKIGDLQS